MGISQLAKHKTLLSNLAVVFQTATLTEWSRRLKPPENRTRQPRRPSISRTRLISLSTTLRSSFQNTALRFHRTSRTKFAMISLLLTRQSLLRTQIKSLNLSKDSRTLPWRLVRLSTLNHLAMVTVVNSKSKSNNKSNNTRRSNTKMKKREKRRSDHHLTCLFQ